MVSAHVQLALTWLKLVNTRDIQAMENMITDDFTLIVRPASLNAGPPITGKGPFIERFASAPIREFNVCSIFYP
jgi:ketosteroid isomerase-like protein